MDFNRQLEYTYYYIYFFNVGVRWLLVLVWNDIIDVSKWKCRKINKTREITLKWMIIESHSYKRYIMAMNSVIKYDTMMSMRMSKWKRIWMRTSTAMRQKKMRMMMWTGPKRVTNVCEGWNWVWENAIKIIEMKRNCEEINGWR